MDKTMFNYLHSMLTCNICVPFLKFVKDLITSWLISSIDFFQSALKPFTICVTLTMQNTNSKSDVTV